MKTNNENIPGPSDKSKLLKLGIDVHLKSYTVAAMHDNHPKPPQRFAPADFLLWVQKQIEAGHTIVSCYEAGPLGYVLHRKLCALGVTNHVIRPRDWDDNRKKCKTDCWDARSMLNALDRFVAGNKNALVLVRVPTPQEEQRRSLLRLRHRLQRETQRLAQVARGIALNYGFRLKGKWYGSRTWPRLQPTLPDWLQGLLHPLRQTIETLRKELTQLESQIKALVPKSLPAGMGPLTWVALEAEICNWNRFKNRRQVGSLTGLTPSEKSSGDRRVQGAITKCGNPRLRTVLCEMAWRLLLYQPDYRLVKTCRTRLRAQNTPAKRKQQAVALAHGFAIDWWRLRTGQTTPQKLGLKMND